MAVLTFLAAPAGRVFVLLALTFAGVGGLYLKGRADGRAVCFATGERDVAQTMERAQRARDAAGRRDADERRLRDDDTFRRD